MSSLARPVRDTRPRSAAADDEPLFRPEVIAESKSQWMGTVLLEPRTSSTLLVTAAIVVALALIAALAFGSFTRKARVNGWLVPEQGIARIFSPQAGVISEVLVREGMRVAKGFPLVALSSEVRSESVGATREEIVRRLGQRKNSLLAAAEARRRLFRQQSLELSAKFNLLTQERQLIDRELELHQTRLQYADQALIRRRNGGADYRTETEEFAERASRQQILERNKSAHQRSILELEGRMRALPLERQLQLAEIEREIASLEQELAEAEARRQIIVAAPHDGTITGIQTELGGNATTAVPLMSLVPNGTVLQAELFAPSRAIGFIRAGQRVLLRYQAFPYQKFGQYEGTIKEISRTAIGPSEMPQQLRGMASLFGPDEPIYRVTVSLARQSATAYGEPAPLQPGMQLEADIAIETRRLYEWLLDPLYSLTGKMKG